MLKPHLKINCPDGAGVFTLRPAIYRELEDILGADGLLRNPDDMDDLLQDRSPMCPVTPPAVAIPQSFKGVSQVLALANREGIPVTPRGGGSGKVGGAIPLFGGILLCTHRLPKLTHIDARSRILKTGVGATLEEVQHGAIETGLFYPPDPGAPWASIGGTIATNAGGPSAMKYGVTSESVLALKVALASGEIIEIGHQSPKGVVGLDLVHLFAGSEGTLGVILEATLKLRPRPEGRRSLFVPFASPETALSSLGDLMASGVAPRAAEFFDFQSLKALCLETGGLIPEAPAGLLIEVDGPLNSLSGQLERAATILSKGAQGNLILGETPQSSEALWQARRNLSKAVKKGWTHYVSEDVGLPPTQLPTFMHFLQNLRDNTALHILAYGHAGDGNLHVNILFQNRDEEPVVNAAVREIFKQVIALGGTLSGEHGIGAVKRPYLPLELTTPVRTLMQQIKKVMDPKGIMNPGKAY